jgi:cytochrome c oxidase cbb3-type subunit 3
MTHRALLLSALALATTLWGACDRAPLRPPVEMPVAAPDTIVDFAVLYGANCAGCHGPHGEGGVALGLGNPVYLAIADDATLRRVTANGVPGTAMPAFAQSAGGMLTAAQIDVLVHGMRTRWARPGLPGAPVGLTPPPYAASSPGDPSRGAGAYAQYCASCHGAAGRGGPRAGSIVDAAYLALVSDQNLRTTLIAGRPDIGHPDWRADMPGTPMSSEDVSDVTAWLAAQRPRVDAPVAESRKDMP